MGNYIKKDYRQSQEFIDAVQKGLKETEEFRNKPTSFFYWNDNASIYIIPSDRYILDNWYVIELDGIELTLKATNLKVHLSYQEFNKLYRIFERLNHE